MMIKTQNGRQYDSDVMRNWMREYAQAHAIDFKAKNLRKERTEKLKKIFEIHGEREDRT